MQFFVIFLFVIVAVATAVKPNEESKSEELECEPGKVYMKYCNRCRCTNDGKLSLCTKIYCDKRFWNPDGSRKEILNEFLVDDEADIRPDDEAENRFEDETDEHNIQKRQVCTPRRFSRNYCNTCKCNEDGTARICTQMRCAEGEFERDGQRPYVHYDIQLLKSAPESSIEELSIPPFDLRCEPEKTFKFYCNTCKCVKDGIPSSCTLVYCPPSLYNRDGSRVNQESVLKEKNEDLSSVRCEPNKNFNYYCNQCKCSESGTFAYCSGIMCPPGVFNRDGSLVNNADETGDVTRIKRELDENEDFANMKCEPSRNFMHYCNRCRCSKTGIGASCTFMACPPGVYYRDGTLKVNRDFRSYYSYYID